MTEKAQLFHWADRRVITLEGPDARALLQRVITADAETLQIGQLRPGALLTPQGKIIADFMMHSRETGIWLDIAAEAAPALHKRLSMYKLKADVVIALSDDLIAVWSEQDFTGAAPDPRLPGLYRAIQPASDLETAAPDDLEIAAGVPSFGRDYGEAEVFPTDVNLDVYDGIGWTKGCFIGQEVVSRMKRRGTIRKRTLGARFEDTAPAAGTAIKSGDLTIGEISSSSGQHAVSRVRLDRLEKAQGHVTADGLAAQIDVPEAVRPAPAAEQI